MRYLNVLTPSFPARRSSDLRRGAGGDGVAILGRHRHQCSITSIGRRYGKAAASARVVPKGKALLSHNGRAERFISAREKLRFAASGASAFEISDVGGDRKSTRLNSSH